MNLWVAKIDKWSGTITVLSENNTAPGQTTDLNSKSIVLGTPRIDNHCLSSEDIDKKFINPNLEYFAEIDGSFLLIHIFNNKKTKCFNSYEKNKQTS